MRKKTAAYWQPFAVCIATAAWLTGCAGADPAAGGPPSALAERPAALIAAAASGSPASYLSAAERWHAHGIPMAAGKIDIPAASYAAAQTVRTIARVAAADGTAIAWQTRNEWVEYEFVAEREGLYALEARYAPADPSRSAERLLFSVELNGEQPFAEAGSLVLDRYFKERDGELFDNKGNQLRSAIEPLPEWRDGAFRDSDGAYAQPVLWHLKQGANTLRISSLLEPAAVASISFVPPETPPAYAEARASYPEAAADEGKPIVIEAERFDYKSSASIPSVFDRDPATTPTSYSKVRLNALGGNGWGRGRQAVVWSFEAPRDGRYTVALRVKQSFRENLTTFRTVSVDGRIPFREWEAYPIPYAGGWQSIVLSDAEGRPYEVYLTQGKHTLTLESTYEPFMPVRLALEGAARQLDGVYERLRQATGNRVDPFRVWNVEQELPGLTAELQALHGELTELEAAMKAINGKRDNVSQSIRSVALSLGSMLRKPDEIPYSMPDFLSMQAQLEQQREDLTGSPLLLEKIAVTPAGSSAPRMKAGWLAQLQGQMASVYHSFDRSNRLDRGSADKLQVWMMWSRDYVDELQRLADERFTPLTGKEVQINLIASQDLLIPSSAAGILPDVALGIPSSVPYEMAIRGAALDISRLPGAERLLEGYSPGMLTPYAYDGGYYGLPETANLKVLFYRKDILERLNLDVPDTWEDVYAMLPSLLQNDSNFYVDPADASYMFFQRGIDYYTEDGRATALDRPEAYEAFREWTDLFNRYGLERQVQSFFNQFRKGTMPIGISDMQDYMRLLVAAPELTNRWGIAPVPGTRNREGEVERWISGVGASGSASTSVMMFNQTDSDKRDTAWSFVQWYLSDETQTLLGTNLEQFYGAAFRWNAANVRAFARMPWRHDDLRVFLEQWQWIKEVPNVPGGYMTARELGFAWNRATIDLQPPRISLDQAVKQINRELARKRQEFEGPNAIAPSGTNPALPIIIEPWKEALQLAESESYR